MVLWSCCVELISAEESSSLLEVSYSRPVTLCIFLVSESDCTEVTVFWPYIERLSNLYLCPENCYIILICEKIECNIEVLCSSAIYST